MLRNSPKSLIDAVSKIVTDSASKYDNEQQEIAKAQKELWEAKLSPKQKKIAKMAGDPNKIDAHDLAKLRGEETKTEETLKVDENKDTPGNSTHQCAVHVKSEQFGEGKTLFSQHAVPSEDGTIEWYDVMFEHGIEKQVPTSELEILVSESHMNHKKKMKEEVEQVDEARGRPRKNPLPAGSDENQDPDDNIVMHLKKSVDTHGGHDVKFSDGSKHKVAGAVSHKVLSAMGKLKPSDRLELQKHIGQSHKNLMDVHKLIK